ncbi:hypothetical protein JKP88DRAFT_263487 [Tribonema minus]|uniref:Pentacotripeptide-repeat region of PRORP domain-containing protein n=1 Tax=Tribonema minus TaxID=303371 RepID=A0A835Z2J7_9STRA|nr:hypothetical protein JKP88DRAFT_263487 [Tribonema minus]
MVIQSRGSSSGTRAHVPERDSSKGGEPNVQQQKRRPPSRDNARYLHSAALRRLSKTSQWRRALETLDTLIKEGFKPHQKDFSCVLKAMANCGQYADAMALLDRMRTVDGIMPDVICYMHAIAACGEAGAHDWALVLLGDLKEHGEPDVQVYNAAIAACAKASACINAAATQGSQWKSALHLLREMKKAEPPLPLHRPAYNAMLKALAGAGQWGPAIGLLTEMCEDKGAPDPDNFSLSIAMDACTIGNRPDLALRLFDDARGAEGWLPAESVDIVCYGTALKACAVLSTREAAISGRHRKEGERGGAAAGEGVEVELGEGGQRAKDLLLEMTAGPKRLQPNAIAYSCAISALGAAGSCSEIERVREQMATAGVSLTPAGYTSLIAAYAQASAWNSAVAALAEMQALGLKANVICYTSAIDACARAGQYIPALGLLQDMIQRGIAPNQMTFGAAIRACAESHQWQVALQLLSDMETGATTALESIPELFESAAETASEAHQPAASEPPVVSSAAAASQDNAKEGEGAHALPTSTSTHRAAVTMAKPLTPAKDRNPVPPGAVFRPIKPDLVCYSAALNACSRVSEWGHTLALLETAKAAGVKMSVRVMSTIIAACARDGQGATARGLLEDMPEMGLTPTLFCYMNALRACAAEGLQWDADDLIGSMEAKGIAVDKERLTAAVAQAP